MGEKEGGPASKPSSRLRVSQPRVPGAGSAGLGRTARLCAEADGPPQARGRLGHGAPADTRPLRGLSRSTRGGRRVFPIEADSSLPEPPPCPPSSAVFSLLQHPQTWEEDRKAAPCPPPLGPGWAVCWEPSRKSERKAVTLKLWFMILSRMGRGERHTGQGAGSLPPPPGGIKTVLTPRGDEGDPPIWRAASWRCSPEPQCLEMADHPGGPPPPLPGREIPDAWTMPCGPRPQVNEDTLAQGIPRTRRSPPRSQRQGTRPLWALFITWDF